MPLNCTCTVINFHFDEDLKRDLEQMMSLKGFPAWGGGFSSQGPFPCGLHTCSPVVAGRGRQPPGEPCAREEGSRVQDHPPLRQPLAPSSTSHPSHHQGSLSAKTQAKPQASPHVALAQGRRPSRHLWAGRGLKLPPLTPARSQLYPPHTPS